MSVVSVGQSGRVFGALLVSAVALAASIGPAEAQSLPDKIRIGAIVGLTGPGAATTFTTIEAWRMAVKDVNESGGILGKPIELVVADDQANPTQAVAEAQRLAYQEKVNVIIGPPFSQTAIAAAPVLTQAKIFFVGTPGSTAFNKTIAPYGFSTYFSVTSYVRAMVAAAANLVKAKKVAVITDNGGQAKDAVSQMGTVIPEFGMQLVGQQQHEFQANDITPQMLSLRRAEPDVLLQISSIGEDGGLVIKTMDDIDWKLPVVTQVAAQALMTYLKVAGPEAFKKHTIYALNYKALTFCQNDPIGASTYAKFTERLKAFDPPNGEKISPSSATLSYDDVMVVKAAIEGAKSVDGPTLAAWLEQNASKVTVVSGVLTNPTGEIRQLFGESGLAFTLAPEAPRSDGLVPRAGC